MTYLIWADGNTYLLIAASYKTKKMMNLSESCDIL